jgi:hypothetical protein
VPEYGSKEERSMYLISVTKYMLREYKRALALFYAIQIILMSCLFAIVINVDRSTAQFTGAESIGITFIFVVSLASFKETFRMLIQNGVSRKTMIVGQVAWILCMSAIMSVIDRLISLVGAIGTHITDRFTTGGLLEQLYPSRFSYDPGNILTHFKTIAFSFCLYAAFAALGYLISHLYYRMNTAAKVAVSISVPCFLIIGLPIIDRVTKGKISYFFERVSYLLSGVGGSGSPLRLMAFSLLCCALLCGLSWLLLRRAQVKY